MELIAIALNEPVTKKLEAKWFFEDETIENGLFVKKTFSAPGKYFPEGLLFRNSNEITRAVLSKVPVKINIPPVSNAGDDKIAATNEMITFDGISSKDEDGRITSYSWDFGDGNRANGIRVRHSFQLPTNIK